MGNRGSGFTLIELMVVIVIIGVLASLAIPRFTEASTKSKAAEAPRVLASYESAQLACLAENGQLGKITPGATEVGLIFERPTSKFWSYSADANAGAYAATATKVGGGIATTASLITTVDANGTVTNRGHASLLKLLPNFSK